MAAAAGPRQKGQSLRYGRGIDGSLNIAPTLQTA